MGTISARISWEIDETDFTRGKYSRKHQWHFDSGTVVDASSSPDIVPVPYSDPNAVDPEEAFVAAISSCHMLWFLAIAARLGFNVRRYQDLATGTMGQNAKNKTVVTVVTLHPVIEWSGDVTPTREEITEIHHQAHEQCFIANSVNCEIKIEC